MEPVGERVGVDVCMVCLFVFVLFGKGWVSGIEIFLLNLLLDPCLVTGGEVRWLLAGNFASLALAWLSVSRGFVLDFGLLSIVRWELDKGCVMVHLEHVLSRGLHWEPQLTVLDFSVNGPLPDLPKFL